MHKIHNYTGHPYDVVTSSGELVTLPVAGRAYVENLRTPIVTRRFLVGDVERSIEVRTITEKTVVGLPPEEPDTLYLVSWPVARIVAGLGRTDVLIGDNPITKGVLTIGVRVLASFRIRKEGSDDLTDHSTD